MKFPLLKVPMFLFLYLAILLIAQGAKEPKRPPVTNPEMVSEKDGIAEMKEKIIRVAVGNENTCIILISGKLKCWGKNDSGQLGIGVGSGPERCTDKLQQAHECSRQPKLVQLGSKARDIAIGRDHVCAVVEDGRVFCWGDNLSHTLGIAQERNERCTFRAAGTQGLQPCMTRPTEVPNVAGAIQIGAGDYFTCALLADGKVKCWGGNQGNALGRGIAWEDLHGDFNADYVKDLVNVKKISVGDYQACALLNDGSAKCWGANTFGQLGSGSGDISTPQTAPIGNLRDISSARFHTCATTVRGDAYCWGRNDSGLLGARLGQGKSCNSPLPMYKAFESCKSGKDIFECSRTPKRVINVQDAHFIESAFSMNCVGNTLNTYMCWGVNGAGQLGVSGPAGRDAHVCPDPKRPLPFKTRQIAIGGYTSCAVTLSNELYCWGGNWNGMVGNGKDVDVREPEKIDF